MTVLREWTFEDLNGIAELEKECFSSEPWNLQALADSFLSGHFYGALLEEEGAITSYGGISVVLDEGELQLIATAEMYRKCGRAQKILRYLTEEAAKRGARRIFLEVRVSNAEAQKLYLKNGFRGVYARTRYYPDGEDAVVMKKELV